MLGLLRELASEEEGEKSSKTASGEQRSGLV